MVGVPGKSKGCSTCRRRKKGCDQKRPICGQCSASGYVCGGYQRELTFVFHPASKAVEKAIFLPVKPQPSQISCVSTLERFAVVAQCRSMFFELYLPYGRCAVNDQFILKCGRPANWTSLMQTTTPSEMSLELAFAAFSISRVGRNKGDRRLIKESTKFYGKALKTLQKALYDPNRMYSEQILTACLLLGLYETFEGAGGKSIGWVSHAQGAARIVELRGPERHADQPAHLLFLGTRLPIIYSAVLRRKKTFLSEERWLTMPWHKQPKNGLDRLVDIAAHVPSILEQFDAARSQLPSTSQRQSLQSCLALCRDLQKSLSTWCAIRRPGSEAIPVEHISSDPNDNYPFSHELIYENHLYLNANLIHWSAALAIASTVSEVEYLLGRFGYGAATMFNPTASAIQEAQDCAKKIAQSIPYCLWPDMGDLGLGYIQFPMCLAFQYFMKSNESTICSWILQKAKQMQNHGMAGDPSNASSPTSCEGENPNCSLLDLSNIGAQLSGDTRHLQPIPSPSRSGVVNVPQSGHSSKTPDYGKITPGAQGVATVAATLHPDYDAEYDSEGDYGIESSQSDTSSPMTVSSDMQEYSRKSGSHDVSSKPSIETWGFAFVQENPSQYYIDRTGMDMSNSN